MYSISCNNNFVINFMFECILSIFFSTIITHISMDWVKFFSFGPKVGGRHLKVQFVGSYFDGKWSKFWNFDRRRSKFWNLDQNRTQIFGCRILTELSVTIRSKMSILTESVGQNTFWPRFRSKFRSNIYFGRVLVGQNFRSQFFDCPVKLKFRPLFFRPNVFGQNFCQKAQIWSKSSVLSVKLSCPFCSALLSN